MGKKLLLAAGVLAVVAGGVLLFLYRHHLFRPDFDKVGGTEIVFEVAEDDKDPRLDELCRALRQRFDPTGGLGVVVRPEGERRVAVRVPNGKHHDELVQRVKETAWRTGRLEFCIVANSEDDGEAIAAARETLRRAGKEGLARLEKRAEPPPAPAHADGSRLFRVNLPDEPAHSYHWVEAGKSYLYTLGLNQAALDEKPNLLAEVERREKSGEAFVIGTHLYCVRKITDWTRRPARDRELGKTREFFVLMRDPREGQAVTGDYIERVSEGRDSRGRPAIDFELNKDGGDRFYELTSKNKPSGGEEGFRRQLAILFDGQVMSAPSLMSPIRQRGQVTGEFTQREIDDTVLVLRAGALPVRLLPEPVRESVVAPGK
jgi:preprotein translocase subunit SecD